MKTGEKLISARRWLTFAIGAIVCLISACNHTPSIKEMTIRMRNTDSIKITDMRSVVNNGTLVAQVTIINNDGVKPISYRFRWLSKNGLQVGGDDAWKPITVRGGQSGILTGVSPNPSVVDFKFELTSE